MTAGSPALGTSATLFSGVRQEDSATPANGFVTLYQDGTQTDTTTNHTNGDVTGAYRLTIANANVPNMVGQISTQLADDGLNIEDLLNKSIGDLAYTIVDVDGEVSDATLNAIRSIEGVLTLRNLGKPVT